MLAATGAYTGRFLTPINFAPTSVNLATTISPLCSHSPRRAVVRLQSPPPPTPAPGSPEEQQAKYSKLFLSILIDLIGVLTYAVPAVGEAGDLAWAPISALLVYQLYGNGLTTGIAFAEELLPGLDIIPTATIAWLLENTDLGQNLNEKAPPSSSSGAGSSPPWTPPGSGTGRDADMKRAEGEEVK